MGDPTVSGQPLFYHLFATFDCAAITQVTGIGLPVVFFRLCMVPMVVLAVLGIAVAGAAFGGAWTGPVAVVLVLFVGELNLDPHVDYKFANEIGDDIVAISPSFLMGAALFAPALALLCELGRRARTARLSYGALAALALLVIGAAGAKAPTAPVLAACSWRPRACACSGAAPLHPAGWLPSRRGPPSWGWRLRSRCRLGLDCTARRRATHTSIRTSCWRRR